MLITTALGNELTMKEIKTEEAEYFKRQELIRSV